jgi:hypothetical protein
MYLDIHNYTFHIVKYFILSTYNKSFAHFLKNKFYKIYFLEKCAKDLLYYYIIIFYIVYVQQILCTFSYFYHIYFILKC